VVCLTTAVILGPPPVGGRASAATGDLEQQITSLQTMIAQSLVPPNFLLEEPDTWLNGLRRTVAVAIRQEYLGDYIECYAAARSYRNLAVEALARAHVFLDQGDSVRAQSYISEARTLWSVSLEYDRLANEVWRGNLAAAQAIEYQCAKTINDFVGLAGQFLKFAGEKLGIFGTVEARLGLALSVESSVLNAWLDAEFKGVPTAAANAAKWKAISAAANYLFDTISKGGVVTIEKGAGGLLVSTMKLTYDAGKLNKLLGTGTEPSQELLDAIWKALAQDPELSTLHFTAGGQGVRIPDLANVILGQFPEARPTDMTSVLQLAATGPTSSTQPTPLAAPVILTPVQKLIGNTPGIEVQWLPVSGATSYEVWRNGVRVNTVGSQTSFLDSRSLTAGQTYQYYVVAVNSAGSSSPSNTVHYTVPRSTALMITATPTAGSVGMAQGNVTASPAANAWILRLFTGSVRPDVSERDITLTGLPPGLTVTARKYADNNIEITLGGTASAPITSRMTVSVVVKASAVVEPSATPSDPIDLTILPRPPQAPISIITQSPIKFKLGNEYRFSFEIANQPRPNNLVWTLDSGALPDGLSMTRSGEVSGKPTSQGTFDFTVRVQNTEGATDARDMSIVVGYPQVAIDLNLSGSIPGGIVGRPYSTAFRATGGSGMYTWTRESGTLPDGLSLSTSGVLEGTPTTTGTFRFTVKVADSERDQAERDVVAIIGQRERPIPVSPGTTSGSTERVGTLTPTLQWRQCPAATGYRVNISVQGDSNVRYSSESLPSTRTSFQVPSAVLHPGYPYIWDVEAFYGSAETERSDGLSFSVPLPMPPTAPMALTPGSTVPPGPIVPLTEAVLRWQTQPGTDGVQVIVGDGETGAIHMGIQDFTGHGFADFRTRFGQGIMYRWYAEAVNSAGRSRSATMYFRTPDPPSVGWVAPVREKALAVDTASLPSAVLGQPYSATLKASGLIGSGRWIASSLFGLPPGLTLSSSGTIAGTPLASGRYRVMVSVTDSTCERADQILTLHVTDGP